MWDTKVSDLVLPGIAFTLKKNILIFYTNPRLSDHPITVYTPRFLHGEADCDVPLVYCYDGSHYEGLIPETIEDEQKCSRLVELWGREEYMTYVQDIPVLWNQLSKEASHIQGDFFNWASPENVSRLAPPKNALTGPPPHFEKVLSMAAERGEIPNTLTFLIPRGGQSGTLTFF